MRANATFPVSVFSFLELSKWRGQVENADVWTPRISRIYFSNFYKSDFSVFTCSQIRKLGLQKSEIFKHLSFRYSPIVKYENDIKVSPKILILQQL